MFFGRYPVTLVFAVSLSLCSYFKSGGGVSSANIIDSFLEMYPRVLAECDFSCGSRQVQRLV